MWTREGGCSTGEKGTKDSGTRVSKGRQSDRGGRLRGNDQRGVEGSDVQGNDQRGAEGSDVQTLKDTE